MKCKNCGQENTDDSKFCSSCGQMLKNNTESKNMILALVISFILTGLGIAYAGNRKKAIIIFVLGIIFNILGMAIPLFAVIGILIWAYGLYYTYNEVKIIVFCKNLRFFCGSYTLTILANNYKNTINF